jgi:hypothetical protein
MLILFELNKGSDKKVLVLTLNETLKEKLFDQMKNYVDKRVYIFCEVELAIGENGATIVD